MGGTCDGYPINETNNNLLRIIEVGTDLQLVGIDLQVEVGTDLFAEGTDLKAVVGTEVQMVGTDQFVKGTELQVLDTDLLEEGNDLLEVGIDLLEVGTGLLEVGIGLQVEVIKDLVYMYIYLLEVIELDKVEKLQEDTHNLQNDVCYLIYLCI